MRVSPDPHFAEGNEKLLQLLAGYQENFPPLVGPLPSTTLAIPSASESIPPSPQPADGASQEQNSWAKKPPSKPKHPHLHFVHPTSKDLRKMGVCSKDSVAKELEELQHMAVGFFMGHRPLFSLVKTSLAKQWQGHMIGSVNVFLLHHGGFVFEFSAIDDRNGVIEMGNPKVKEATDSHTMKNSTLEGTTVDSQSEMENNSGNKVEKNFEGERGFQVAGGRRKPSRLAKKKKGPEIRPNRVSFIDPLLGRAFD
ncbi:hypothetical protein NE237_011980 [Protea cynaroides]|uniref:DUF4283 domain-containing protein n=1 Tax=Protea cynaroides TaxID=273540 RepID=A0A9Q0H058_9MAGN|nr:hypothetical protein NE237_011980 [Protea cynaroides]